MAIKNHLIAGKTSLETYLPVFVDFKHFYDATFSKDPFKFYSLERDDVSFEIEAYLRFRRDYPHMIPCEIDCIAFDSTLKIMGKIDVVFYDKDPVDPGYVIVCIQTPQKKGVDSQSRSTESLSKRSFGSFFDVGKERIYTNIAENETDMEIQMRMALYGHIMSKTYRVRVKNVISVNFHPSLGGRYHRVAFTETVEMTERLNEWLNKRYEMLCLCNVSNDSKNSQ